MTIDTSKLPNWILKEEGCNWCNHPSFIVEVKLTEKGVCCLYKCLNDECDSWKYLTRRNLYGITFSGRFIESYKKHQEEKEVNA